MGVERPAKVDDDDEFTLAFIGLVSRTPGASVTKYETRNVRLGASKTSCDKCQFFLDLDAPDEDPDEDVALHIFWR